MSTIFKKIIDGKIPCNKVYEDDFTLAFHDIDPQAPVHVLVIPKLEVKNIQDLDEKTMSHCLKAIQKTAQILGVDKEGYRVVTNCGKNAGQEVEHLHFHILGGVKLTHIVHKDDVKKSM